MRSKSFWSVSLSLVERLATRKLRAPNQQIGARALLRPLEGAEIHDYVDYLLRWQGTRRRIFSRGALEELARLSGGLSRKINKSVSELASARLCGGEHAGQAEPHPGRGCGH